MKIRSLAGGAAILLAAASGHAQFAKVDDAVKYRQGALFVMAQHFGRVGAMANGRIPYDPAVAIENAELVAQTSKLPWQGFGPGTDKPGIPTRAKPEVWSEDGKFKAAADQLQLETTKLVAAAKTNNLDNLKQAFRATAAACKNCHDQFRKD